jgi:flagellum-specific peptidoglycan hydrolase FlgJ
MKRIGQDTEDTQATATGVNFDQLIENVLAEDGILPATAYRLVVDQARLESNNYTSNVFLTNNNLVGYKYVEGAEYQDGPGLLSPEGDYYANYDSLENSVHEISGWWQRRSQAGFNLITLTSIDAYATALQTYGWFTSPEPAYAARMLAVDALVSLEGTTGISTQGTSLTALSVGTVGLLVVLGWAIFSKT